ncbi:MAG: asparagine synthase (glutamine-hydrolyzing) [Bdellovibrionales bacterium]|nr:asparagine synthase (glutamine-hydrolyzing) [Bdellovibrionales bacterium]
MCGIAGYFGTKQLSDSVITKTLDTMKKRGPDSQAYKSFIHDKYNIHLLHSRLSIIDIGNQSSQPFTSDGYTIIYNGELYNYLEIRKELEATGILFTTNSDTEVFLKAYIQWGPDCLKKCEGMWALAIYDSHKRTLFLSRDRFGEKPFFTYKDSTGLYFASETKTLRTLTEKSFSVNSEHIKRYLVNGFRSLYKNKQTFFKDISYLSPRTYALVKDPLKIHEVEYWFPRVVTDKSMSLEDAIIGFKEKFTTALSIRLRSDVPLAFCLSGGVDSASIASTAVKELGAKISTFSIIDFDYRYDEEKNIDSTILDLDCNGFKINTSKEGFFERLKSLINYHDAPLVTISYYVHSFLSEAISKQGFRVALSGTGADEMLTGYYDHFLLQLHDIYNSENYASTLSSWEKYIKPFVRNPHLSDPNLYLKNDKFRSHIYLNRDQFSECLHEEFTEDFYEENYHDSLLRNRMLNELFNEIVPPILHEDDLNSMMHSIENRSPFLDSNLLEFCLSIPAQHLISNGYAKFILREAMDGVLNNKVRLDREKKGFNASLNSLVDFNNPETCDFLLAKNPVFDLVDRNKIKEMLKLDPLPNSFSKFLFNFINIKFFLEEF